MADTITYLADHQAEVADAARLVKPHIRRTPLLTTDLDPNLRLKPECFQVTGSFKPRGAFNAVLRLRERKPEVTGVVAVSSGNHAQAVALAARTAGLKALILIPEDASPTKMAATRALGAEVVSDGVTFENRDRLAEQVVSERGYALIHPYDVWDVIHGQGTAALELLEDEPELGAVLTPVGGGGLLCGTALAVKSHDPAVRVVGVEPKQADDAARTFKARTLQRLEAAPQTIADGVRTVAIGRRNFEVMVENRLIDDIITVSEREIEAALLTAWTRLKLALEPTGALALAGYLKSHPAGGDGGDRRTGKPTALILTGGNFPPNLVARLLAGK